MENIEKVLYNIDDATDTQTDSVVIQQRHGRRIDILTANATGTSTADLKYYPVSDQDRTKVSAAALINAVSVSLDADDTGLKVGEVTVTTADFCIIELDNGDWQLFDISSVTADAPNDEVDLGVTAFGGGTGLDDAVSAGARAYIVRLANVVLIDVGNASISLENVASGSRGNPLGVSINEGAGGTIHRVNGVAQYTE